MTPLTPSTSSSTLAAANEDITLKPSYHPTTLSHSTADRLDQDLKIVDEKKPRPTSIEDEFAVVGELTKDEGEGQVSREEASAYPDGGREVSVRRTQR